MGQSAEAMTRLLWSPDDGVTAVLRVLGNS